MRLSFFVIFLVRFALVNCRRRGRNGRQSKEVAPVIVGPPSSVVGLIRGTVVLVCNATGNPRPHIEWYKGKNIKVSRNRYEIAFDNYDGGVVSTLWIFNARDRRDGASYTCQASNRIGRDNRQAEVTLIDENNAHSGYPQIITAPHTDSVERNRSVSLPCRSSGAPTPTIHWYKDYLPLHINASRMNLSATGTLVIFNSAESDAGSYHCSAQNRFGVVFSEAASVYIRFPRVSPWFKTKPLAKYEVQQNGNLNITCVASGQPMPNVKWQKITRWGPLNIPKLETNQNSNEAVFGDEVRGRLVGRVVLMIKNAQESANYSCVASSTMNTTRANTKVLLLALPKPPVYLRRVATDQSSSSLRMRWKAGDEEPVNSYTIYYRLRYPDNDGAFKTITDVSSTSFTVIGLKPYTDYEFRVSAVNPQGEGNKSKPLYLKTQEATPASSPVDVKAYLFGINTVMVVWSEPVAPNGVVSQYKLYYTSDDILPVQEWRTKVVDGSRRLTSLRNLSPSVTYSVRVSALTSVGEGPLSQAVMVKTEQGVPSQPRNFRGTAMSSKSIRFVWEKPAGDSSHDHPIISYTLVYRCAEQHCVHQKQITFPPSPDFTLLNLRPVTSYRIKMAAQTRFGKGPFTSTIVVRTLTDVPSAAPQEVKFSSNGENWIRVNWNPPFKGSRNGELTNYTVYYSTIQNKETASTVVTSSAETNARITGLKPFTTYYVWVSASTSRGEGPTSSAITAATAESKPEVSPRNVSAIALNSTSIRVRWKPVPRHLSNGNIRGYQVAYVVSDAPTSRTHIVSTYEGESSKITENQVLEYVVTKLQPKTRYSLSVAAFTIKGAGPASEIKYATTSGKVLGKPTLLDSSEDSSALISWGPPHSANSDCTGYVLQYRCSNCPVTNQTQSGWVVKRFDRTTLSFRPTKNDGIFPGWSYTFKLAAVNDEGPGAEALFVFSLPAIAPSQAPESFGAETVFIAKKNSYGVQLNWSPPPWIYSNGQITGYRVYWRKSSHNDRDFESSSTQNTKYLLPNVKLGERYEIQISAQNAAGEGPKRFEIITVSGSKSTQPNITVSDLHVLEISTNTVWLSWVSPKVNQPRFLILVKAQNNQRVNQTETVKSKITLTGLDENTTYNITVTAFANYRDILATPQNECSRRLSKERCFILQDLIDFAENHKTTSKPTTKVICSLFSSLNGDGYTRLCKIFHVLDIPVQFGSRWILLKTAPKFYLLPPQFQTVSRDATVTLTLPQEIKSNSIKQYILVVVPWNKSVVLNTDSYSYETLKRNSRLATRRKRGTNTLVPYITAVFDEELPPRLFSLGDGLNAGDYVNKILLRGTDYRVFLRVIYNTEHLSFFSSSFSDIISIPNKESAIFSGNPTPKAADQQDGNKPPKEETSTSSNLWIIGVIAGCLFVLAFVVLFFVLRFWRARGKGKSPLIKYTAPVEVKQKQDKREEHDPVEMRRQHYQTSGMKSHPPIPLLAMSDHVERLSANDNLKFSQEYDSIDPGQKFMWENSNMEINKSKNRYANVVAYDHSRLTLSPIDGVLGSDYINANYISGYRRQNAYIATQGPTRDTIPDFWRMVWEQRSNVIVMMTKCEERSKVKCDKYWPSDGNETYGFMKVTLVDEMQLATYSVRTMVLYKRGCNERREIKHFQYTAWPDHGVPEHPTPVLNFMRRVKSSYMSTAGPIVVHCSAGVGRAGCFICIDSTLERMKQESTIDIYGQVTCMRAERNYMVQTEDQYIFIHYAILEAINCGNTELPARNLYSHLHKLTTPKDDDPVTAMELEFKRLACSKASASRFVSANLHCNKFKNRLVNILPYEGSRVCLKPIRGVEGSDYINASFIDGYRQKQAYIATQGPLFETTDDFWRMLWEHESTIVVMLTQLNESGRDKCYQYWPEDRSERYQYFVVDPMKVFNMPQYILREFKVTDARDGQSRTIRQFHFTDWPEQAVPKSGEGFIDFIGQVHKTKEQFGQEGPITIHCSAGVGRTGVFITLSIALERMRFENVVDMFQTVKMLRTQRPAMVQTEDQYQFCYRAALEYLGSFDHYTTA